MKIDESCPVTVYQKKRMAPDIAVGIASAIAIAAFAFITCAGWL